MGTHGGGRSAEKAKHGGLQRTHLQPTQLLLAQLADQRAHGNYPRLPDLGGQLLPIQLVLATRRRVLRNREKKTRQNGEKDRGGVCFTYYLKVFTKKKVRKN